MGEPAATIVRVLAIAALVWAAWLIRRAWPGILADLRLIRRLWKGL